MFRCAFAAAVAVLCLSPALVAQANPRAHQTVTDIAVPPAAPVAAEPPPPCSEDCYQLAHMTVRGSVTGTLTFEMTGSVRAKEEQKIPLFGPPSQVRLDDLTIDGARPTITFDNDRYYLITSARSFTLRGKIALGTDQIFSVAGPLLSLDAQLARGRLVEGEKLSGLSNTILHFDPMTEGAASAAAAKPRTPPVFRLARSVRFGSETTFVYRLVASQSSDLGTIRLPLSYGEKVQDVQGATGWQVEGEELVLPTSGHDAEITIAGALRGAPSGVRAFKADERSAYEWWMIEADPEHRVAVGGEAKLVEATQSPIPPTMPGARVYLLQRGQQLEIDARSLVRGDVLAAVARKNKRFLAVTGAGEVVTDESLFYDNNGLEHLMVSPAGRAMYLSTDGAAQRILHTEAGARDVLVPMRPGSHQLRVQSLSDVRLTSLAGTLTLPASNYPIATSATEVTVGLPEHVRPLAVLGGDHARWAFGRADLVAAALGVAFACFGFRTRRTRALGAVVTAGLWLVSREAFVLAAGCLFVVGAVFLASRFVRGSKLVVATGAILVATLFTGRHALSEAGAVEPSKELFADHPSVPVPESAQAALAADGSLDTKAGITPVSLSIPLSERYVQTSRQLVTKDRPLVARILYVTSTTVALLHLVWLALALVLAYLHRERLAALKASVAGRLTRRRDPGSAPVPDAAAPL